MKYSYQNGLYIFLFFIIASFSCSCSVYAWTETFESGELGAIYSTSYGINITDSNVYGGNYALNFSDEIVGGYILLPLDSIGEEDADYLDFYFEVGTYTYLSVCMGAGGGYSVYCDLNDASPSTCSQNYTQIGNITGGWNMLSVNITGSETAQVKLNNGSWTEIGLDGELGLCDSSLYIKHHVDSVFGYVPSFIDDIHVETYETTTTTTTSTTTTTISPGITTNSTNYLFVIFVFVAALSFSLIAFAMKSQYIPAGLASLCWFALSMLMGRIRFIGDFSIAGSTYYVDAGNPEIGYLWLICGLLMGLFTFILILEAAAQTKRGGGVSGK